MINHDIKIPIPSITTNLTMNSFAELARLYHEEIEEDMNVILKAL